MGRCVACGFVLYLKRSFLLVRCIAVPVMGKQEWCELKGAKRMKPIVENPYRIVGLLSNAGEQDLRKRKDSFQIELLGGEIESGPYDFPFLPKIARDELTVARALADIELNQEGLNKALFWFMDVNASDREALEYLVQGYRDKAEKVWEAVIGDGEVNDMNYSAYNNLGTLYLCGNTVEDVKLGVSYKLNLLQAASIETFAKAVMDKTDTMDQVELRQTFLDELWGALQDVYTESQLREILEARNTGNKADMLPKYEDASVEYLESQVEASSRQRKSNKSLAYTAGMRLYKNTKSALSSIDSSDAVVRFRYSLQVDRVANEILQCATDYIEVNRRQGTDDDYLENSLELLSLARDITKNPLILYLIDRNSAQVKRLKVGSVDSALTVLREIRNTYLENKQRIEADVNEGRFDYQGNRTWSQVYKTIEESVDWEEAIKQVSKEIPPSRVEEIKSLSDAKRVEEYKYLVEFFLRKLTISQAKEMFYLVYWRPDSSFSLFIFRIMTFFKKITGNYNPQESSMSERLSKTGSIIVGGIILVVLVVFFSLFY